MKPDILIGIDADTSVVKSVAFAINTGQLAVAAIPNDYVTLPDGGAEQDMTRTWADVASTLKRLAEMIPDLADRLIAMSVTVQGDGMWLIDREGEPVGPAMIWLDSRAASIVEDYVNTERYNSHYARAGAGLTVVQMSAKLAWTKHNRPDVLAKATMRSIARTDFISN
jgi:erythritol kinase (D-erythritol 1-phosphate-forming)